MDSFSAFQRGQAARAAGAKMMVFDWLKAAQILRERGLPDATAGLESDMEWTGGPIMEGGKPVPKDQTYTFLSSIWATPILVIDGEEIPCWVYEEDLKHPADENTYWPDYAMQALSAGEGR